MVPTENLGITSFSPEQGKRKTVDPIETRASLIIVGSLS